MTSKIQAQMQLKLEKTSGADSEACPATKAKELIPLEFAPLRMEMKLQSFARKDFWSQNASSKTLLGLLLALVVK